ncbi:MAG: hypothetical protein ACYC6I_08240 [Bacillota bacterium]
MRATPTSVLAPAPHRTATPARRALVAVLIGLALIATAIFLTQRAPSGAAFLPKKVMDLTLKGPVQTGQQATAQISGIHGTGIAVDDAAIGQYEGPAGQAMLWVSESADAQSAQALLAAMDQAMPGDKTFTGRVELQVDGLPVYRVDGAGMTNYYYRLDRRVYWLGYAGSDDPLRVLRAFLSSARGAAAGGQ